MPGNTIRRPEERNKRNVTPAVRERQPGARHHQGHQDGQHDGNSGHRDQRPDGSTHIVDELA
jgi:hypothetical protein